ncbi:hypothetical protein KFZ70_05915 [Tamlana fucoidanivorans]|uniref:Uncharacterized protein n=1 Tax=Allotamlana fucoidanivorans TaxID=2583814 RepID=A0A5C4STM7_9FLAO|nr:hypothetical protein [Tamlana fucoidanivorans]TNJ46961.1 hypothetical protein FGF67_00070 [Tamlana fucoidanivorans]
MKNYILKIAIFFVISLFYESLEAQQKSDIKVLYVGFQPERDMPKRLGFYVTGSLDNERFKEEYPKRYSAFIDYLNSYFKVVKGVDARDYDSSLSAEYDVTIFDHIPDPKTNAVEEKDENGQTIGYKPPKYISDEFDHATIFIGHTAPVMSSPVGSKLDWYCLCLDAHAHNINYDHTIFNQPYEVELTIKNKPIPSGALHYLSGKNLPDSIPMWQVQTEGYLEGKGYRIGQVSSFDGFLDSPETEFISGGVSTKDINAVAIGRHGNFLLWGFSASPDYMTEEAKKVFANAVHYMSKFKGQKIIAKKTEQLIFTRKYIDQIKYYLTEEAYQEYIQVIREFHDKNEEERTNAIAKKERGETLTSEEEQLVNRAPRPRQPDISWEEYIKKFMGNFHEQFGNDVTAYTEYLDENIEYIGFEKDKGYYGMVVDEDVKSLKVSTRKLELLSTCIDLLKKGEQDELVTKILNRYTEENFETADEWQNWFDTNKNKLFFTEAGGYKWLVNTL